MTAAGLILDGGLEVDSGKTVRCRVEGDREKRGWYRLSTIRVGDEDHLVGAFGIWRGADNGKVAIRPGPRVKLSREQREAISAKLRADAAKVREDRPFVFADLKSGLGVDVIVEWFEKEVLFLDLVEG